MPARNLIDVDDVSPAELVDLLDRAAAYSETAPGRTLLAGVPVLNLFFESSTRTATSFTLAEQRVVLTTLADLRNGGAGDALPSPALLIVGDVAGLHAELAWFGSECALEAPRSA